MFCKSNDGNSVNCSLFVIGRCKIFYDWILEGVKIEKPNHVFQGYFSYRNILVESKALCSTQRSKILGVETENF